MVDPLIWEADKITWEIHVKGFTQKEIEYKALLLVANQLAL